MEKFLNAVRSSNLVQALLCIAFGLFLMFCPSLTVRGIITAFGAILAVAGAVSLVMYFRQRGVRRDVGSLSTGILCLMIALLAFAFPRVIAGFFSLAFGVILMLCALVNMVRAFGLRAFGGGIWIVVLVVSLLVGVGGLLVVVNPFRATLTFVFMLGAIFVANGAVDLFIEWYLRDIERNGRRS